MNNRTGTVQEIQEQIEELSQDSLSELARYIDFLRFRERESETESEPLHIVELRGLLKGYDFSPEFIAEARREMWKEYLAPQS